MSDREHLLPETGLAAPPRDNGELVFSAPWESRIFGITLALQAAGRFEWPEFQAQLIRAIALHEAQLGEGQYQYYACWLEAFRSLATEKRWFDDATLAALEAELAARPSGHDHGH